MAKVDEQIAATGFTVKSRLSFDELEEAADDAAFRAAAVMTKVNKKDVFTGRQVDFDVVRAGMVTVAKFSLRFESASDSGLNMISLIPGEYVTSRPVFLMIPVGPKTSAGLPVLKKFSNILKASIAQTPNT